tara:strand:- start:125 stop:370 length:246 start_codon:yes stop_codon:yes gene_type:complete
MSERPSNDNENVDGEAAPETAESAETAEDAGSKAREQAPAHVPPHLRDLFTKHEGAVAARPGFRNPSNAKSKAQRKKKKKR